LRNEVFKLPQNYPFGGSGRTDNVSIGSIISDIPENKIVDMIVDTYFDIFERTYRVIHVPSFLDEIQKFRKEPYAVDPAWLALFMSVLGLGCQACPAEKDPHQDEWQTLSSKFLFGAQECLLRTAFMSFPNMANIQTLCLMVIAKQFNCLSCYEADACWPLSGLLSRLAMGLGYHLDGDRSDDTSPFEQEMSRRLWTTIVYLELQQSLQTGMPLLLRGDDFTASGPLNINDDDISPEYLTHPVPRSLTERTHSCQQVILHDSLPLLLKIIHLLNSEVLGLTYADALNYNTEIRALLRRISQLPPMSSPCEHRPNSKESIQARAGLDLQKLTLEVFYRRILLALHRRFACSSNGPIRYPDSYWSSLESSLGLLVYHRALCEASNGRNVGWIACLYRHDFLAAALTACIHLLRKDPLAYPTSLSTTSAMGGENKRDEMIPPRATILETLKSCVEIWERTKSVSICHGWAFHLLDTTVQKLSASWIDENT
jgi:hypothetical protein